MHGASNRTETFYSSYISFSSLSALAVPLSHASHGDRELSTEQLSW